MPETVGDNHQNVNKLLAEGIKRHILILRIFYKHPVDMKLCEKSQSR